MRSASSSSRVATKPPTTSLWPPRYLVEEWMTTSAPSANGFCSTGVANVLSTTTIAPRSWASSLIASMSTMRSHGLLGVSTQTIRVPGCHAAATASRSPSGTVSTARPAGACTWTARRMVPP